MDTKAIQINRRSANIVEGKSRAPNRSMFYAMGYQEGDFRKPMDSSTPMLCAWLCTRSVVTASKEDKHTCKRASER